MPLVNDIRVGQMLLDERVITPEQLEAGLQEQKKSKCLICTQLIRLGFASEERIFSILSRQLRIPYIRIRSTAIPPEIIKQVPARFASHYRIMPLSSNGTVLTVAMADPLDMRVLDDLRLLLSVEVKGVLASEDDIMEAIRGYYGVGAETLEKIMDSRDTAEEPGGKEEVEDLGSLADDASIITFVNQILTEAIKARATDIHFEPYQNELRVRFRIDGLLYDIHIPDSIKFFHPAIVSRIKIMAQLNITERRFPQDGRIKIRINDQELDIRVSVLPTIFGESVQVRILSASGMLELGKLGLAPSDMAAIESYIRKPHGIIFVTGPTGSGKSTTLYASLSRINSEAVKIITIEDPVEYQMRGVNQIQVQPSINFTFALALRHMLRHDPDVMMIGEVRDYETAEIAIRSALTGHLVFSTLHTNDAAGAVTRLLDMGIEPFLVASSLECLIAQRLVRVICPECKEAVTGKKRDEMARCLEQCGAPEARVFEGKGCERCRKTGYFGRTAIYEILPVTEQIREMVTARASSQQIKQKAIEAGMKTLRQDGIAKVLSGTTTITEVMRVTQDSAW